jgi:hypothetical protein
MKVREIYYNNKHISYATFCSISVQRKIMSMHAYIYAYV